MASGRGVGSGNEVGSRTTRLITLRGSSGSGKSSVAAALRAARAPSDIAIVGQDVARRQVLGIGNDREGHAVALIDATARLLLRRGLDVIVEGILNADRYTDTLVRLVADHRGISRSYIWDLPFEETLTRHGTKPVADAFGEREMRAWWRGFQPVDGLDETVIGPDTSLDGSVRRILTDCWPTQGHVPEGR